MQPHVGQVQRVDKGTVHQVCEGEMEESQLHFREWPNYLKAFHARGEEKRRANILKIDAVSNPCIFVVPCKTGPQDRLYHSTTRGSLAQPIDERPVSSRKNSSWLWGSCRRQLEKAGRGGHPVSSAVSQAATMGICTLTPGSQSNHVIPYPNFRRL